MRRELKVKDCSLTGVSDLTVIAPIKRGFVPGLDAVTYRTRVKRVLQALHTGRQTSHEFELGRMLSDAVERVGRIHSVRMAVIEPQDSVLLAVTFDGAWESYVRTIWQKVARVLDLVFCNTEDYVIGWDHSYDEWGRWLRGRQAETKFLFTSPGLTVDDVQYLQMQERLQRHAPAQGPRPTGVRVAAAEEIGYQWFKDGTDPTRLGLDRPLSELEARPALFRQGLRSLAGVYRLTDLYPPHTEDGPVLQRAAQELLPDFMRLVTGPDALPLALERAEARFGEQLDWFRQRLVPPPARVPPPLPKVTPPLDALPVQGGILKPYACTEHGVLLLVACESSAALATLIENARPTTAADQAGLKQGDVTLNVSLSIEGLRLAGLTDDEIEQLPPEFAQGMERRAGLLGDLHGNHPARWRLPARNWADGVDAANVTQDDPVARVELNAVHVVLQARYVDAPGVAEGKALATPAATARPAILGRLAALVGRDTGALPLSLQWMQRQRNGDGNIVEHFGFRDGDSDPAFSPDAAGRFFNNQVHLGEALIGHPNAADPAPLNDDSVPARVSYQGSFLVVRKLRQDIALLDELLAADESGLGRDDLLAHMMGRWPDGPDARAGKPLVRVHDDKRPNDFDYAGDINGSQCPFHAHIRRTNPRSTVPAPLQAQMGSGRRPPRIFRRGMGYGPRFDRNEKDPAKRAASLHEERGLVFMAYVASLGEQFEVVQRWVAGGNSSGGYSGVGDPFVGLAAPGMKRVMQFDDAHGNPVRVTLDGDEDMLAEPRPLVRLEWGSYYLTPSLEGLATLVALARARGMQRQRWSVVTGRNEIARLQEIERRDGYEAARLAWKAALEDPEAASEFETASIWAAIRAEPCGAMRTPYGVLVADYGGVERTLMNADGALTSTAYLSRMRRSFGEIYLGRDDGPQYRAEQHACNTAIMAQAGRATVDRAHAATRAKLDALVKETLDHAQEDETLRRAAGLAGKDELRWELVIDVRELIDELLATFCEAWFLQRDEKQFPTGDNPFLRRSGFRWTWKPGDPPCYPGHFMAPSRYIFQPHPAETVEDVGASHGSAMLEAMGRYLYEFKDAIVAPVTRAVLDKLPPHSDETYAARTVIGALMGMVPTVDANLRRVMETWLKEGTLVALRGRDDTAARAAAAEGALHETLQQRPAPDTLWRTATRSFEIGPRSVAAAAAETTEPKPAPLEVQPNDMVVAGLTSAAHERLERGELDVRLSFGGLREQPDPKPGQPLHACPGYTVAREMMLGFVGALVECKHPLRAGPGALTIAVSGRVAYMPPPPAPAPAVDVELQAARAHLQAVAARGAQPRVLRPAARLTRVLDTADPVPAVGTPLCAFGDSWLTDLWTPYRVECLVEALIPEGYEVVAGDATPGMTVEAMAEKAEDWARAIAGGEYREFKAILLCGGGNDIVQPVHRPAESGLFKALKPGATDPESAIDRVALDDSLGKTGVAFGKILRAIRGAGEGPIIVHAYDYPVPDGRRALIGPVPVSRAWLKPKFELRGLRDEQGLNRAVMRILIDKLNEGVAKVCATFTNVHYLDLRGVAQTNPTSNYKDLWANELHPNAQGYKVLAKRVADKLGSLGIERAPRERPPARSAA